MSDAFSIVSTEQHFRRLKPTSECLLYASAFAARHFGWYAFTAVVFCDHRASVTKFAVDQPQIPFVRSNTCAIREGEPFPIARVIKI